MSKQLILATVARAKHLSSYHGKWFTDDVFIGILKSRLNLPDSVTNHKFNTLLSRHVIDFDCNDIPNHFQLFRRTHYNDNGNRRLCYFICSGEDDIPPVDIGWSQHIHYRLIDPPRTRSSSKLIPPATTDNPSSLSPPQVPSKRKSSTDYQSSATPTLPTKKSSQVAKESRWQAPETMKLFTGATQSPDIDIQADRDALRRHVASQAILLRKAYLSSEGWRDIIDDKDEQELCSPFQIFKIQQKAKYLYATLACALKCFGETTNNF